MNASEESGRDREYRESSKLLDEFGPKLESLLGDISEDLGVNTQQVTHRVKTLDSVEKKLQSKSGRYSKIVDLTDLLGARIVTYLSDEVDLVATKIREEFEIDENNSVDKRAVLESDQFGYLSLHFIARIKEPRASLPEYRKFRNTWFELQIRSVLQHAWAEIEHDLGYKASQSLPAPTKRRFSRLSALLEVADDEFAKLKADLSKYEVEAQEAVQSAETGLRIDQATLTLAVKTKVEYMEIDRRVAAATGFTLTSLIEPDDMSDTVETLREIGVLHLDSLTRVVTEAAGHIEKFAEIWVARPTDDDEWGGNKVRLGIGIFYAIYVLVGSRTLPQPADWSYKFGEDFDVDAVYSTWEETVSQLGPISLQDILNQT